MRMLDSTRNLFIHLRISEQQLNKSLTFPVMCNSFPIYHCSLFRRECLMNKKRLQRKNFWTDHGKREMRIQQIKLHDSDKTWKSNGGGRNSRKCIFDFSSSKKALKALKGIPCIIHLDFNRLNFSLIHLNEILRRREEGFAGRFLERFLNKMLSFKAHYIVKIFRGFKKS